MGKHGFFAVDVRRVAEACAIGERGLDVAATYIAMAAGSDDQGVTTWAAQSASRHIGARHEVARAAIQRLIEQRLIEEIEGRDRRSYKLLEWRSKLEFWLPQLTRTEQHYIRAALSGEGVAPLAGVLDRLRGKGWVNDSGGFSFECDPVPQLAWLPTVFVTGTAADNSSPLAKIRGFRDPLALRLVIDLYHAQVLPEFGGVPANVIRREHKRDLVSSYGQFNLWRFGSSGNLQCWPGSRPIASQFGKAPPQETDEARSARISPLWRRLELLEDCGILEFQPYLADDDPSNGGSLLHPISWGRGGTEEQDVGRAAHRAAVLMSRARGLRGADNIDPEAFDQYDGRLVPVLRRLPEVQLISIARLRYRPHTKLTKIWRGLYMGQIAGALGGFERITADLAEHASVVKMA